MVSTAERYREIAAAAKQLGHSDVKLEQKEPQRTWYATCSCGWVSRRAYALPDPAVHEARLHLMRVVYEARGAVRVNGVSQRPDVAAEL